MNIKKILFIPTRPYRSDKTILLIAKYLKKTNDHELYYIDFESESHYQVQTLDNIKRKEQLTSAIDNVELLSGLRYTYNKSDNKVKTWFKLFIKTQVIRQKVKKINPDGIITMTSSDYTANVLATLRGNVKLFHIQQGVLSQRRQKLYNFKHFIFELFGIYINPRIKQKKTFSHFLWSKTLGDGYYESNSYFCGNILHDDSLSVHKSFLEKGKVEKLLFITQPINKFVSKEEFDNYLQLIDYCLTQCLSEGIIIEIVVHPREKMDDYKSSFRNNEFIYSRSSNINFNINCIAITGWSGFLEELMIKGVPVFAINPNNQWSLSSVIPINYPYMIYNKKNFDRFLSILNSAEFKIDFEKNRGEFISIINTFSYSGAVKRVGDKIIELLDKK